TSGNCNTATCRSRQWQSSSRRPTKPGPGRSQLPHDHAPCQTDCGVIGTNAKRSTATSRSSPAAAWRCAEGAGLDGGDRSRSTINRAVHRVAENQLHRRYGSDRLFAYITNLHLLDRRDHRSCPKCHTAETQEWLEHRQAEMLPVPYFH